jgi:hypothetical protein
MSRTRTPIALNTALPIAAAVGPTMPSPTPSRPASEGEKHEVIRKNLASVDRAETVRRDVAATILPTAA